MKYADGKTDVYRETPKSGSPHKMRKFYTSTTIERYSKSEGVIVGHLRCFYEVFIVEINRVRIEILN